ncbi:MAG: hypothetical protein LJF04_04640 [Gemmatimonadetes bacterium]|nr:hypothetical protein [Gemmatimonadota bacterium]
MTPPRECLNSSLQMAGTPSSIAATSTLAMVRAAEARGVRTADVLRKAGVARELIEEPDARQRSGDNEQDRRGGAEQ